MQALANCASALKGTIPHPKTSLCSSTSSPLPRPSSLSYRPPTPTTVPRVLSPITHPVPRVYPTCSNTTLSPAAMSLHRPCLSTQPRRKCLHRSLPLVPQLATLDHKLPYAPLHDQPRIQDPDGPLASPNLLPAYKHAWPRLINGRLVQIIGQQIWWCWRLRQRNQHHLLHKQTRHPLGLPPKRRHYGQFVCKIRPENKEPNRTRLMVGGDRIFATPTADKLVAKSLFNSVISTIGARFMTMDISNFYLNTPLK
eukprot:CCRYP_015047-RA/>CCRYP_015047-RA protein AED:0.39 eAED:0.47 QI:0/0/0/1/0/0/2/0/253